MEEWEIKEFDFNGMVSSFIEFKLEDHPYMMMFTKVSESTNEEIRASKGEELGLQYRPNSYMVKFDLIANFKSGDYYKVPEPAISCDAIWTLQKYIVGIIAHHYEKTGSEAYYFVAENKILVKLYNRLAKIYASEHNFVVNGKLGDEGAGYEIRTGKYQS